MKKMTLAKQMANRLKVTNEMAERIIEAFFELLKEALENSEEIEIRGFGSFRIGERKAHKGRSFQMGEQIEIPAKKTVIFRPGSLMKIMDKNSPVRKKSQTENGTTPQKSTVITCKSGS